MKSLARSCFLGLACIASWGHAAAPDPSLVGCWRAVKIVQYSSDGSKVEDASGRCTLQFTDDQLVSICATASGSVTSTYRYRIDRPNSYATTMLGSTFRTGLVGSTREYEYRVEGDRLTTSTQLHTTAGAASGGMLIATEAARTPCR